MDEHHRLERFALATSRAEALEHFVPGTEDYYFHRCLLHEQRKEWSQVEQTLRRWIDRHGQSERVTEIRHRLALLRYEEDPKAAREYLQSALDLHFDHEPIAEAATRTYPTSLDPTLIARDAVRQHGLAHSHRSDLAGFTDAALPWLLREPLQGERLRHLLGRLSRPDHRGLVDLVLAELADPRSGGFGSLPIHRLLLHEQLEELVRRQPALLTVDAFVDAYLVKLWPGPDVDWEHDQAEHEAFLSRQWRFVAGLGAKFDPLRAHVLYHRLDLDRRHGIYDRDRFEAYLRLPRRVSYARPEYLRQFRGDAGRPFRLDGDYRPVTLHSAIHSDLDLVRDYLEHLLRTADDPAPYAAFVRTDFLHEIFATTKILAGLGDRERWISMLGDPAAFGRIEERVELRFAPDNPRWFRAHDPVALTVDIKNVSTLELKIFEINTLNVHLVRGGEVDTSIDLDGLVPSEQQVYERSEPPLRQIRQTFELPTLRRPGVYVVELLGGGVSSRALVCKGRLRALERIGAAGHVFTILDEQGQPRRQATLWLGGREYEPDEHGEIRVPFSTRPGRETILLRDGEQTAIDTFHHRGETYRLAASLYVDRESLLRDAQATVVVCPSLRLSGTPVSLSLLEQPALVVRSTDHQGTSATQEISDFTLHEDRESTHTFAVPPDLRTLEVTVRGQVRSLSTGETIDVQSSRTFELNATDEQPITRDLHLARTEAGYVVYLYGRSGEPRAGVPLRVRLRHRELRSTIDVMLQTDPRGRVSLGHLRDITVVSASCPRDQRRSWVLPRDHAERPASIHATAGETIRIPWIGVAPLGAVGVVDEHGVEEASAPALRRGEISLLEWLANSFARDHFEALHHRDGMLEIEGLPAGDYQLWLGREDATIMLRVIPGAPQGRWLVGERRELERSTPRPLQIAGIEATEPTLSIRLRHATADTRVHVFGTRFVPAYTGLRRPEARPRAVSRSRRRSHYVSGRDIGDEYRYILERRRAPKYPGVMLERPGLLLAPWAIRSTQTSTQAAAVGGAYAASAAPKPAAAAPPPPPRAPAPRKGPGPSTNLDFLAPPAAVWVNLRPDAEGIVQIPQSEAAQANQLRIVAVSPDGIVERDVVRPEVDTPPKDLRLRRGLDPAQSMAPQRQITVRTGEQPLEIADVTTAKVQSYDTQARVFALMSSLSSDPTLAEFGFVLRWPTLDPARRQALYSQYACHELNLYLHRKDPAFFTRVIEPHLRTKKHRTFLDHYLLGDDLSGYLRPWAYGRLNVLERILLAQRIEGQADPVERQIRDLDDLRPDDLNHTDALFRAALAGAALDTADPLGLSAAAQSAVADAEMMVGGMAEKEERVAEDMATLAAASSGMRTRSGVVPPGAKARFHSARALGRGGPIPRSAPRRPGGPIPPSAPEGAGGPGAPLATQSGFMGGPLTLGEDADDELPSSLGHRGEWDGDGGGGSARDLAAREQQRRLFQALDTTKEWAENNYYQRSIEQQGPDLIPVNPFWRDFAAHRPPAPFLSPNIAHAASSFCEMMCALAVLDLPWEAEAPQVTRQGEGEGGRMTLRGGSRSIVVHEQIRPAPPLEPPVPILVAQTYLRDDDRHRHEGGEIHDKPVTGELLVDVVYTAKVVLTNPTGATHKLALLLQIPVGALPVAHGSYTRGHPVELPPQGTATFEYSFYFPAPGQFDHFPAHLAKDGHRVAAAPAQPLTVVAEPGQVDRSAWAFVSQHGEDDEVLRWLDDHNLERLVQPAEPEGPGLELLAWRMKDRSFYERCLTQLEGRHVYHHGLWSYALHHDDRPRLREFLRHEARLLDRCGAWLQSPVLEIDPVVIDPAARHRYQHLEYAPWVNARSHRLGAKHEILNERLAAQYTRLLGILRYQPALSDDDRLAVVYYWLLLGRTSEGLELLGQVDRAQVQTPMQLDYLRAYAHVLNEQPQAARELAERYRDYPVDRWRNLFAAVVAQVDELDGAGPAAAVDPEDRQQQQATLAATEPDFDLSVAQHVGGGLDESGGGVADGGVDGSAGGSVVTITYHHVQALQIGIYRMDIELLFSRQPFVQQQSEQFSMVKPNHAETIALPPERDRLTYALPESLRDANVVIELRAHGRRRQATHFAHALTLRVSEPYGQLQVLHRGPGTPLPRTYVKVYARDTGGAVEFYKDGYTDLRGRFDYASLSTDQLSRVERFSMLVMSPEHGSVIREVAPPKR